jgi:hypothetical protein
MNHEGHQGVLAIRQGERRSYIPVEGNDPPVGDHVFAVCLISVPFPPEPRCPKAEGWTLIAAFKGENGTWGWINVEKDTKTMICEDMLDECMCEPDQWYWLLLSKP